MIDDQVLLYIMLCGFPPFRGETDAAVMTAIRRRMAMIWRAMEDSLITSGVCSWTLCQGELLVPFERLVLCLGFRQVLDPILAEDEGEGRPRGAAECVARSGSQWPTPWSTTGSRTHPGTLPSIVRAGPQLG